MECCQISGVLEKILQKSTCSPYLITTHPRSFSSAPEEKPKKPVTFVTLAGGLGGLLFQAESHQGFFQRGSA